MVTALVRLVVIVMVGVVYNNVTSNKKHKSYVCQNHDINIPPQSREKNDNPKLDDNNNNHNKKQR